MHRQSKVQGLVWALALTALSTPLGASGDPFYDRLFYSGTSALAAGDAAGAARKLRISCFGQLDAPPARLATCLGHLALAQAAAGDGVELKLTVERLLEIERQFQGVSRALVAGSADVSLLDQRDALEDLIKKNSSAEALSDLPAFRWAALELLPADERLRELNRRIAVEPRQPEWRLLLAELYAEQNQFGEVVREAQHLLDLRPSEPRLVERARCLRALARSAQGDCAGEVLADLGACAGDLAAPSAARQLGCLIGREDLAGARSFFEQLSEPLRSFEAVVRWEQELRKLEKRRGS